MPGRLWHPALDQDGTLRDGAEVAELTGMVDLVGYPAGTRVMVRRERPHPRAQPTLFDQDEGLRHQVFLTDTPWWAFGAAGHHSYGDGRLSFTRGTTAEPDGRLCPCWVHQTPLGQPRG